jgi:prepilin-type N-terminal cleavage/methylation domain-containing protein
MKKNRGFTLIEVLLVSALVVVAALLMYSFLGQGFSLYTVEAASADEQMNLRQTMSEITNLARVTDAANISVSSGVLTVGSKAYKLQNGQILRNGGAIANNISTFEASVSGGMLKIRIVNSKGTELKTSLALDTSQGGGTA